MPETLPPGVDLPPVLLTYQQRLCRTVSENAVTVCDKSRRIGATWGIAGGVGVLTAAANKAAGGMDVFYIGFNLDMTKEFIDTSAMWAKAFKHVATEVEEFIFKDDNEKDIQAFRIKFDSGFDIVALTSRPRSLRGRQGLVIIDEAAFHDDLAELVKAALALLMWGGKVLIISTHDGVDNQFNKYIEDIKAGRRPWAHMRIDLDQALAEGLYKRICLVGGETWSQEAQDKWRTDLVKTYGEGADEELFCIPRKSGGTYIPRVLTESRMQDITVIRLECDKDFVFKSEFDREREILDWCMEELKPLLDSLDPKIRTCFGEDFGRSGDLTVLWPLQILMNLVRRPPFVVELRNVPFAQQRQIVWFILDRLPRFSAAAFDARGNGQQLAEETMQRYGANRIHQVMINIAWYADAFPKYKGSLEQDTTVVPRDDDILSDHCAAEVEKGVPRIPDKRNAGADKKKRHGDSLVAAAMAHWASLQENAEYGYEAAGQDKKPPQGGFEYDDDDDGGAGRNFMKGGY